MTSTYRLTRSARHDLQGISDFWAAEVGEELALRVVGGIVETIITMSRYPQAGVAANKIGVNVRKFPAGKYMVYYCPYSKGIEILHVFHGGRDQLNAWRKGSEHPPTR